MRAGPFSKRVTIQAVTFTRGTDGGLTASTATHATRWAKVTTPTGSEKFRFAEIVPELTHVVVLREYLSTVTAKMRVTYDSRTLEVKAVLQDDMRQRQTTLLCVELP